MAKTEDRELRELLVKFLRGSEAHAEFKDVLDDFPVAARGAVPKGAEHSAWQELEHIRIALHDLLDFSTNPNYVQPNWPEDYWPKEAAPASDAAWDASVRAVKKDIEDLEKLVGIRNRICMRRFRGDRGRRCCARCCWPASIPAITWDRLCCCGDPWSLERLKRAGSSPEQYALRSRRGV